ncbi:2-oxoacid:acceptor oxidoreductase subunit alpha [Bacillus horti]|uniref:2-oxoglutarate ferredoxin oxidoreductase subunit alpha n=1 Tax=Caldalkalibacillus horti TaxID=77523 RepID=A0ABT9VU24_9BACI|nr:2-oxoacid:acceptor oxidoreductase subunit alpha [Bacillus horti]MDQ0164488.1 2-oxoglutarate ferredoxin oxidoreductase subunit alpha [Bacillus horti]
MKSITWMVGGQQGDGFSSSGETFALGLSRLGYYIYGYFTNSSRILGGHANYRVRISTDSRLSNADNLDLLVAFDLETVDINASKLCDGGLVLCDSTLDPVLPEGKNIQLIQVPMIEIAEKLGTKLVKNMVAVGASAAMVGVRPEIFTQLMEQRFSRKGEKIVSMNVQAILEGYEYVKNTYSLNGQFELPEIEPVKKMLMTGNSALGLGSVAAGCRSMYAYPITPATDIMEYMAKKLPKLGGIVLQTEDEIAAITMTIGSGFAGSRAMTATSGPGLALMMEAIGLSGMTETPVVIINTQRGGPSTGLPTKHEQSDLFASLYGTHGEIPKIVLAPSTAEECYYDAIRAFNLAEMYQCPVILLTDLALSQATQSVSYIDPTPPELDRGKLIPLPKKAEVLGEKYDAEERYKLFKRYESTEDGVSPRVLPGTPLGLHHVTGVEHSEVGRPSEGKDNRQMMMDKRLRKIQNMSIKDGVELNGEQESDLLVIGWGSSKGVIEEAMERLEGEGLSISHAHVKVLLPFPTEELQAYIQGAKQVLFVENNATAQLAALTRQHISQITHAGELLKYNGDPFYPHEIEKKLREMKECQHLKTFVTM